MKANMQGKAYTAKIREYADYIDEHLDYVAASWETLQVKCKDMHFIYDDYVFHSIHAHVETHDLSKLSPEEFIAYQRNFFPVEGEPGGYPLTDEFRAAWEHHKEANPHHWQNWTSREFHNPYEAEVHCVCMVIDWMAMALKFGGTAGQYYAENADKIELLKWAEEFIGDIFFRLAGEEECETCRGTLRVYKTGDPMMLQSWEPCPACKGTGGKS